MITLRLATVADAPLLRRWDQDPDVMDSDPDDAWDWEAELARTPSWREQLIAEFNGQPIGCVQIIDPLLEEDHYWGVCEPNLRAIDIWIGEPQYRGRGYGTQIMRQACARCFAQPAVTAIIIDPLESNTRAIRFYERLGFRRVGPRWFGGDSYCMVYRLARADFVP